MMSVETNESMLRSFPGFKFSPTDEELILFYLKKKVEGSDDRSVNAVVELNITQYEPWDLPAKSNIQISNNEWFFFSPRGRRYPKGMQSKRTTASGYWKSWGKQSNVKSGSDIIGTKRTFVFHKGHARNGERTEWILHEFEMKGTPRESFVICRVSIQGEPNLDDIRVRPSSSTAESSTLPLKNSESAAAKDEEKSGSKRNNAALHTFDFKNPPEEISWALVDEDKGVWEPSIDNERVPETSAEEWTTVFKCMSEMKD